MARDIVLTEARGHVIKAGICEVTGDTYRVEVPSGQYADWNDHGKLIQRAMPQLSDGQREFLVTGMTPAEWQQVFTARKERE